MEPLDKAVNYFVDQIRPLHSGSNSLVVIEEVKCDVYSSKMKIRDLGTVNSLGGGTYVISLWDTTIIEDVRKAIMNSLNLNPQLDGGSIKVVVPLMTQEKRGELSKIVSRYSEECLITIRNIRRDMIDDVEKDFKAKLISEDNKKSEANKIDNIIKEYSKKIEEIKEKKIIEINTI